MDSKYNFIRSILNEGMVSLEYCTIEVMVVDVMKPATKSKLCSVSKGVEKSTSAL